MFNNQFFQLNRIQHQIPWKGEKMKDKLIRLFACLIAVSTAIAMVGMSSTAKAEGVPTVNQWCDGTTGFLSFDSDGWRASFRVVDEGGSFVEKHDVASGQVVTIDGRGRSYTAVWSSLQGDDLDSAGDLKDCGGTTEPTPTPTPTPTSTPTSTLTPPTLNQVCSNGQTLVSFEGQGWFADLVVTYEGEVVYSRYGANSGEVMALNAPSQYKVGWYHEPTSTEVPGHSGDLKYCGSDTEEPTEEPDPKSGNLVESSLVCRPEGGGTVTTTTTPWTQDWVLEDGKWVLGEVVFGYPVQDQRDATEQECPVTKPTPTPTPTDPPSGKPSGEPTAPPSGKPSGEPTDPPSGKPTDPPTTGEPTDPPSGKPTDPPTTGEPTDPPSGKPTGEPTKAPATAPSDKDKSDPSGPAKTGAIGDDSTDAILAGTALAAIMTLALVAMRMGRRSGGKYAARS